MDRDGKMFTTAGVTVLAVPDFNVGSVMRSGMTVVVGRTTDEFTYGDLLSRIDRCCRSKGTMRVVSSRL